MYLNFTFKHSRILEKSQSYKKNLVKYCIIAKIHIPQMYMYINQYLVIILYVFHLRFQFYAVYMKIEIRRRDSLPTVTGKMKSRSRSSQHRSIAVQTTLNGEDLASPSKITFQKVC